MQVYRAPIEKDGAEPCPLPRLLVFGVLAPTFVLRSALILKQLCEIRGIIMLANSHLADSKPHSGFDCQHLPPRSECCQPLGFRSRCRDTIIMHSPQEKGSPTDSRPTCKGVRPCFAMPRGVLLVTNDNGQRTKDEGPRRSIGNRQ